MTRSCQQVPAAAREVLEIIERDSSADDRGRTTPETEQDLSRLKMSAEGCVQAIEALEPKQVGAGETHVGPGRLVIDTILSCHASTS